MARRGRKRSGGPRTASGQLSREGKLTKEAVIPDGILAQRAMAIGRRPTAEAKAMAMDQRAGTALGLLWARQRDGMSGISERQYRGGEELESLWRRWSAAAGCPPRTPRCGDGRTAAEPDAQRWEAMCRSMDAVRAAVMGGRYGVLGWSMLEGVLMEDLIPPRLISADSWPIGWAALHDALDAVADHFRIPRLADH